MRMEDEMACVFLPVTLGIRSTSKAYISPTDDSIWVQHQPFLTGILDGR